MRQIFDSESIETNYVEYNTDIVLVTKKLVNSLSPFVISKSKLIKWLNDIIFIHYDVKYECLIYMTPKESIPFGELSGFNLDSLFHDIIHLLQEDYGLQILDD